MTAKAASPPESPAGRPSDDGLDELRRYTPEELIEFQLTPYRSARVLREKCRAFKIFHHRDGGRFTFSADDIRNNAAMNAVAPIDNSNRTA